MSLVAAIVAVFVVSSLGSSPVPLGVSQTLGEWSVSVVHAAFRTDSSSPNATDVGVVVALRYDGAGRALPPFQFYAVGRRGARYATYPSYDLEPVYAGPRAARFDCLLTVANNDVTGLRFIVASPNHQTTSFSLSGS